MIKHFSGVAAVATAAAFCALAVLGSLALTGCDKGSNASPQSSGGGGGDKIGVVDVNLVAKALDWDKKLQEIVENKKKQFGSDLGQIQAKYDSDIDQRKRDMGITATDKAEDIDKKLTPQQKQELVGLINARQQILTQLNNMLTQEINYYQNATRQLWLDKLPPIVKQVAQEKKVAVVLSTPGGTLYADPSLDITSAVIMAAKMNPPELKDVELPKISGVPGSLLNASTQATTMPTSLPSSTTLPSTPTGFRP
jgi:Skp family chaperone for outer membrane proteins